MALAFLLLVLFVVVLMIAFFVFPPTKWLQWFYGQDDKADKP
jgi:Na+-driven multidrug efflux pump